MIYLYAPCNPCCDDDGPAHDGWWFGGSPAGANADRHIYGMNFSTDTTIASTVGLLVLGRQRFASATHQDTAVYLCGGDTSSRFTPTPINGEKFSMSTEVGGSSTSLRLANKAFELAAVSERSEKAYFAGGKSEDNFGVLHVEDTTAMLTFASESIAAQSSADLSQARAAIVGLTEGESKGYFCGGISSGSGGPVRTVDKITFASDSTSASSSAELPEERVNMNRSGVSDGDTKGYLCGGESVAGGQPVDTVYKVTFSGDTTANVTSASLSVRRSEFAGMSEGTTKGYISGGLTLRGGFGGFTNAADKITFSSDSVAAVTTADLPNGRIFHTGNSAIGL